MIHKILFLISLSLASLSFSYATTSPVVFGLPGASGTPGTPGEAGENGMNRTIFPDGSSQVIDLSGTDGYPGHHGEDGTHATGCHQPSRAYHDLLGASGGAGGDGGMGGPGGNTGMLTVVYSDLAHLKPIVVTAIPGRGGEGGQAGRGGEPCYCSQRSWTIPRCYSYYDDYPPYPRQPRRPYPRCDYYSYFCHDGQAGHDGRQGRYGQRGHVQNIRLISEDLYESFQDTVENTTVTVPVSEWTEEGPLTLSEKQWELKRNARQLFHSSSNVPPFTENYLGTIQKEFTLSWKAPAPLTQFPQLKAQLTLKNSVPSVKFLGGIWVKSELIRSNLQEAHYEVQNAFPEKQAKRLHFGTGDIKGTGDDVVVHVHDAAGLSDIVQTKFHLKVQRIKIFRGYHDKITVSVPHEYVTVRSPHLMTIHLGKLVKDRMPDKLKYISTLSAIKVKLTSVRTYEGYKTRVYQEAKKWLR